MTKSLFIQIGNTYNILEITLEWNISRSKEPISMRIPKDEKSNVLDESFQILFRQRHDCIRKFKSSQKDYTKMLVLSIFCRILVHVVKLIDNIEQPFKVSTQLFKPISANYFAMVLHLTSKGNMHL